MYLIQLENTTGLISFFEDTTAIGLCSKEILNIKTVEDLIEFIKSAGGVHEAIIECKSLKIFND